MCVCVCCALGLFMMLQGHQWVWVVHQLESLSNCMFLFLILHVLVDCWPGRRHQGTEMRRKVHHLLASMIWPDIRVCVRVCNITM